MHIFAWNHEFTELFWIIDFNTHFCSKSQVCRVFRSLTAVQIFALKSQVCRASRSLTTIHNFSFWPVLDSNIMWTLLSCPQTWLFGKWTFNADQRWAPPGTNFHQFVVPAVNGIRKDCTYAPVAGMMLPKQVIGVHTCEVKFLLQNPSIMFPSFKSVNEWAFANSLGTKNLQNPQKLVI